MLLHDAVRLVARQPGRAEREQHALRVHEPSAGLEVAAHRPGVHAQVREHVGQLGRHEVRHQERVRQDDALDRRVADVPLVPQRLVLEAGRRVAPQQARQAAHALAAHRVALVRHGGGALLPGPEGLGRLAHLAALQVAHLGRDALERPAQHGEGREQRGMAVAAHHLARDRLGPQPQAREHRRLGRGVEVRERAHRARELAHRAVPEGAAEARRGRAPAPRSRSGT